MNQILRNEPITVFGDGTQERAFTYVGDIAPILAVSLKKAYGGSSILAHPHSISSLAEKVQAMRVQSASGIFPATEVKWLIRTTAHAAGFQPTDLTSLRTVKR
jgi:nucleoside-diphosphate-sugar epimerase